MAYKHSILWIASSIFLTTLAPDATAAVCACDAIAPNNLKAMLPNPGLAGQISRVTDDSRGLWLDNGANNWTEIGGVTNVKDFGAVGDGNLTDDTAAIQAAINSLPNGGMVYFPPTNAAYVITNTLAITNIKGLSLVGSARSGTVIQWGSAAHAAPAGIPMIRIKNGFRVSIKSMAIYGNPAVAQRPSAIIESQLATDQPPPNGHLSAENFFEDLVLGGDSAGMATKGIVLDKTPASLDDANDVGNFHRVEITNTVEAAVSIELNQSKAHTFEDCRFLYSKRGVATSLGAGAQGGSFTWHGGDMGGNTEADFDLGSPNDAILISGLNSEAAGRLLTTVGPGSAAWPVTIQGVRWAANGIKADGKMIQYQLPGPLNLIGNLLGDANPGGANPPTIFLNYATDGTANLIGNTFLAANAVNFNPISKGGVGPWRVMMLGNTFSDAVGSSKLRSDPSTVEGAYAGMLGISATTTASNNLRGTATVGGGVATVAFATPEPDNFYTVVVTPNNSGIVVPPGANRVLNVQKMLLGAGFTITPEVVMNGATFDWVLVR